MRRWTSEPEKKQWEVVDVDSATVFIAASEESRDAFIDAIELVGHRVIVKELKERKS